MAEINCVAPYVASALHLRCMQLGHPQKPVALHSGFFTPGCCNVEGAALHRCVALFARP
jgi:hypothetical protein